MSSISVRLEEDTDQLLERLKNIQNVDKAGIMNAIAEDLIGISTIIKNPLSFSKIIECTLRGQSIVMN